MWNPTGLRPPILELGMFSMGSYSLGPYMSRVTTFDLDMFSMESLRDMPRLGTSLPGPAESLLDANSEGIWEVTALNGGVSSLLS